jgi:hypothetical protein
MPTKDEQGNGTAKPAAAKAGVAKAGASRAATAKPRAVAKPGGSKPASGLLNKAKKKVESEEEVAAEPRAKVVRQQPTRQSRSKRKR